MASPPPLEVVARLAGGTPRSLTPIGGGRNSQVFRLEAADGQTFALKAYFQHPADPRDRLGAEFNALTFLRQQGLACVPRPLAMDAASALGLYEFIPGERVSGPSDQEVDATWAFLVDLRALGSLAEAECFPEASEARFSFQAVAENIQVRLERLLAVDPNLSRDSGLAAFLEADLVPAWRGILAGGLEGCRRWSIPFEDELARAKRTLSPSDFGFHNALRTNQGLVFLDFEYFGWDDPAKMLSDFLLHPGMELTLGQRQRFAAGILDRFLLEELARRTRLAFPFFGIKWCIILLNEFLPGSLDRRAFADLRDRGTSERQARQLTKARSKLKQLLDDHADFPYFSL